MGDIEAHFDQPVDPKELQKAAEAFADACERGFASPQVTFTYAVLLLNSTKSDILLGVRLLEELLSNESQDESLRDYIYYLAVAHTKLKNFDSALQYVDAILRVEPTNNQAQDLRELIKKRMRREGLMGGAMLAGLAMFGGAAVITALAVFSRSKRK